MAPFDAFPPEFPLSALDVSTWTMLTFQLYKDQSARGEASRARLYSQRVVQMRRYKELSASEHEYIVTEIDSDESQPRYLMFDRSAPPPTQSSGSFPSSTPPGTSPSVISSYVSSNDILANDIVTPLDDWPQAKGKAKLVEMIKFTRNPPILLDLALIAKIAHDSSEQYKLVDRQCFWYASIISRTLQKIASSASVLFCTSNKLEEVHEKVAETWHNVKIIRDLRKQVTAVHKSYEAKRAELLGEIIVAGESWKDMKHKADDYDRQKQLAEEALSREQVAIWEKELADKKVEEANQREQSLRQELDALKRSRGH